MATPKKTNKTIKMSPVKAATKPPTQAMKPVPVPAPKPVATQVARTISQAERQRMIEEAAYFRAEKENFTGDPDQHWSDAEREVDSRLARENVRVA